MAIIPRGAGGSGGGSSVTISTATPQPPGTAAAGSTGEASDAGHVHDRELPDPTDAHDGQVPTTTGGAYVLAVAVAFSDTTPAALGTASPGLSTEASRADHVHAPATRSPVAPACVSRWLLTDTTSTIDDSVGAYDLAYSGAAAQQSRPSPWGKCLYTGGLAAGAGPKGAASLEPAAVTILVWVRPHLYTSPQPYVVGKRQDDATWSGGTPTNMALSIHMQTDGRVATYALCAGGGPSVVPTGTEKRLALDTWCRVAVSYSDTDGLRLYVDGQLAGTDAPRGSITWGSGSWTVGVNNSGSGVAFSQVFDGFIRDVQVCDRVLTAAEILRDYQQGIGYAP